ncbi:4Fe-4S dicluster domain-containing protein [Halapricum hydrolyticum]|uniref:4Fe-4S dicluster domain-containing protein n=1 Tax=Halapricum hydrolyticum TaxID=2979991 RepID=A0AAE3IB35_9EURY|nr:4Fe-4S dicluster domain-containing protein [Halapricum hydrolyticum]MCU4718279.1 4Fe-4S dicluster domain-containing protein [Halapricum hydrolyticum]MCU4727273.1 4Fe-4S dicluster domain-containing protein [Halapricum hydrolyticum]
MSEEWTFYFDPNSCIGCHACSVACDVRNDRENADDNWRTVKHEGTGEFPDYEETTVSISCMHCGNAPCEKVCPTGAITKRDADGIVTVDQDKCISCHYCGWACPYGAPTFDGEKMSKCHLCLGEGAGDGAGKPPRERPKAGGTTPACVDNCVTDALHAGPVSEMMELASDAAVRKFTQNDRQLIVEPTEEVDPETLGD